MILKLAYSFFDHEANNTLQYIRCQYLDNSTLKILMSKEMGPVII